MGGRRGQTGNNRFPTLSSSKFPVVKRNNMTMGLRYHLVQQCINEPFMLENTGGNTHATKRHSRKYVRSLH